MRPGLLVQCGLQVLFGLQVASGLWLLAREADSADTWPALPERNGAVVIPAQVWPLRPGPRGVRVLVHFPRGQLANVDERTGLMLTLHNWGGTDCVGTANPQALADRLNVVALCVNYLQSGAKDSIEGPEPYDFGYLQALDSLRAVWWADSELRRLARPFAEGRIFATGGSGGGNVALMANKLAPRTFACIVDLCGMKKLSDDIAFQLPGGSDLDARYSRDPASPNHLTLDHQELRFVGNPDHLETMKRLNSTAKIVTVHGVDDATCPFADAVEMVDWMQSRGLDVESHFIDKSRIDGKTFTSTGHSLGDRTRIVFEVAEKHLALEGAESLKRTGPSDFARRETVRYRTSNGAFEIDYAAGYPVGRFVPREPSPAYPNHQDLSFVLDRDGQRRPIQSAVDWELRREHILAGFQRAAGPFPSPLRRVPLDVRVVDEQQLEGGLIRRKLTYQSDPDDRVPAYLFLPPNAIAERKLPAVLCLHQTTRVGKDEPAGGRGDPTMKYALELAQRGSVTIVPDYPSLGEHPYDFAPQHGYASGTMKAVWDNIRAVDVLETLEFVDASRIGVIGHSLGGHNAIFTAVFDRRLKAVVSSCGFTNLQKDDIPSWTGPRYMPLLATEFKSDPQQVPFDFHELVAALAPRPFFAFAASRDDDFDVTGVQDVLDAVRPIYALHGRPDQPVGLTLDVPHSFPDEARTRAYEVLDRELRARDSRKP